MNQRKFGVKDQLGYYFGDVGGSFVNIFADSYYLVFCTYVLGISPYFMGTLFFFAKIWDAINDPLIGSLPDRFHLGKSQDKFKPWIKAAVLPLAFSGIMCFTNVSGFSDTLKYVWVVCAYIFYGMSYTGVSMPYGAMASVITADSMERSKISRARSVGGLTVNTLAMALVPKFIFDEAGNYTASGFFRVAIAFSICSVICYIIFLTLTTERIRDNKEEKQKEKYNYAEVIKGVLKNRPLLGVMTASIGLMIYFTGNGQLTGIVFKEYYHRPQLASFVFLSNLPVMLILFPFIPWLAQKIGKKKTALIGYCYSGLISLLIFVLSPENPVVFLVLMIIGNSGQLFFNMLVWAMVTDCIDYQEYRTGARNDGSVYSIYTLSRKIGSALVATMISYILGWVGFVSGAASQTVQVASNIRSVFILCPFVGFLIGVIGIGLIYNIKEEEMRKISAELKERRKKA